MITGEQVTKARELLNWSIDDLARWSQVSRAAILYFEIGTAPLDGREMTHIRRALAEGGVDFPMGASPQLKPDALRRGIWNPPPPSAGHKPIAGDGESEAARRKPPSAASNDPS